MLRRTLTLVLFALALNMHAQSPFGKKRFPFYRLYSVKAGYDFWHPGWGLGLMQYNYQSFDSYGVNPWTIWGPSVYVQRTAPRTDQPALYRFQAGYEYYTVGLFGGRISGEYLTDFGSNKAFAVMPEVGLSLFGFVNFLWNYELPLKRTEAFHQRNSFSIKVNIPLRLDPKEKDDPDK